MRSECFVLTFATALTFFGWLSCARAQSTNLSSGGPINITASGGIEWRRAQREVIASGHARAVRGNVTVTADRLIAYYRSAQGSAKGGASSEGGSQAADGTGGNEVYLLEAIGHVHIFTPTSQAWSERAYDDLDKAVVVLTGGKLTLETPDDRIRARQSLEYWSNKNMAVARGDAVVVMKDDRRISADVIVGYFAPPSEAPLPRPAATKSSEGKSESNKEQSQSTTTGGRLERVDAIGHVVIYTKTDIVRGDRGVYLPRQGLARIGGNVRITRGRDQLNGAKAEVNMRTGISRLISAPGTRVEGYVVPGAQSSQNPPVVHVQPGSRS